LDYFRLWNAISAFLGHSQWFGDQFSS
jgi:hypothetical protein